MPPALLVTVDQAQDLVDHFGCAEWAGHAIGVDPTTVRHWLNPEVRRKRLRDTYDGLSGVEYNRKLLRHRRNQAITRHAARDARLARRET